MYDRYSSPTVVQKYGGTSLGDIERIQYVAKRIYDTYCSGTKNLIVVVSAMAGETSRLVELVAEVSTRTRPRIVDLAVSAGEQVSVALLSAAIENLGVKAEPLLGFQLGVLTNDSYERARIRKIDIDKIRATWSQEGIPVIAGFQGVTEDGNITTLGRGGSDTSAVAIAAAAEADFCEINTDVDGFYSADPRVVPEATILPSMDFEVALEMASLGSKVLHARSVELAAKFDIPLIVRNTFKENSSQRTIVMSHSESEILEAPVVSGVSAVRDIAKIAVSGSGDHSKLISAIFEKINQHSINVDIIVHDQMGSDDRTRFGFTVEESDLEEVMGLMESLNSNDDFSQLSISSESNLAKVSVVGLGMKNSHGVAYKAFDVLTASNIDIKMISTSEIRISCVVHNKDCDQALNQLHNVFIG